MSEGRTYDLSITINGPQGQQMLKVQVPEENMQACPCGNDLFDLKYRCIHIKPALFNPMFLGVPEVCVAKPIYFCSKCGYELSPLTPTKVAVLESQKVSA